MTMPMQTVRSIALASCLLFFASCHLQGCKQDRTDVASTCLAEASLCSELQLQVPAPVGEVIGVWDKEKQRFVLFGGDQGPPVNCFSAPDFAGETWAFLTSCDAFQKLETSTAPHARGRHVAALAEGRGRMIVHGGRWREAGTTGNYQMFEDTWAFDLDTDTWTEVSSGGGPGPRANHVGAMAGSRFLVHGGDSSPEPLSYIPSDETWSLDLDTGAWEQLEAGDGPPARLFHSGTASANGRYLFIYGGTSSDPFFGPAYSDLWRLDLEALAWEQLHDGSGTAPNSPFWANLMADPVTNRLLLWAGHDNTALGNTNQLWAFDLDSFEWTRLEQGDVQDSSAGAFCDLPEDFVAVDMDAPERRNAGAAAVTSCGEVVIFGGKTDCGLINDVWVWSAEVGWRVRSTATSGEVCPRAYAQCSSLCF